MQPHEGGCEPGRLGRPEHEVADIFRAHGEAYRAAHPLWPEQRKVMAAIETCRTSVLGGHVDVCQDCGHEQPSYNSCRDRHCPKCQALAQARWLEARRARILPVGYFHVVFTVPSELRALFLRNRRRLYGLLFTAASETLLELGRDPKRLGAQLGVTAVLHTWKRDLSFHPHVHCIVTGGGLSTDGERWVDTRPGYLFPVKVMARLFRGKLLAGLDRAHEEAKLELPAALSVPGAFSRLRARLSRTDWHVYAKRPFAGPDSVYAYVGRYTHRVGISNRRLLAVTDDSVTIATRDGRTATMPPQEFIRRFLLHVLPQGFVKLRHYGLMASSNVDTKLEIARRMLLARQPGDEQAPVAVSVDGEGSEDWEDTVERLTGVELRLCPACGSERRFRYQLPRAIGAVPGLARAPP